MLLLIVAAVLAAAGIGWFRRRRWAWRLAIAILSAQLLGGLFNVFLGQTVERAIGVGAAGASVLSFEAAHSGRLPDLITRLRDVPAPAG